MTGGNKIPGNKALHLLFWLGIAAVWFYLRYQDYATLSQAALVTVIKVVDLAVVIYAVNLLLVPRFLYRKKYVLFGVAFVCLVALFSFLKMLLVKQVLNQPLAASNIKEAVYNNFVTQFFLVLASIALTSAFDYIRLQKRLAQLAKEKAEAELAFLKAQINPHFLFNSLNSVYFLIDKKNVQAREALHKFSEMLRYQLYECNDSRIPIEKEIGFLKDYVGLQQLRMADNTVIRFDCKEDVAQFSIEPLLLIPFVENSFKHLSHFTEGSKNEVQINLARQNGTMHFSVYNTTEQKTTTAESGGIGLSNVQKRLNLLYPGTHGLAVKEKDGWYGVELQLTINT
ncbi:MAG TPA: sensor histidine kinase [Flavisolibacter sp.]|nr:sensor histidine kinase [Flavisolibacter sp.]